MEYYGSSKLINQECFEPLAQAGQLWPRGGDNRPTDEEFNPAHWAGDVPASEREAINRIAAALATETGAPIT